MQLIDHCLSWLQTDEIESNLEILENLGIRRCFPSVASLFHSETIMSGGNDRSKFHVRQ